MTADESRAGPRAVDGRHVEGPGGMHLWVETDGDADPLVVLDSGLGGWSPTWCLVTPAVSRFARVAALDRPGYGRSQLRRGPVGPTTVSGEIAAVVEELGEQQPIVAVGHSLGGVHVLRYALEHPERVRGLVLVDPSIPTGAVRRGIQRGLLVLQLAAMRRPSVMQKWQASVLRSLDGFPDDVLAELRAGGSAPTYREVMRSELGSLDAHTRWLGTLRPGALGALPMVVLSQGRPLGRLARLLTPDFRRAHQELAALSTRGELRVATDSGHMVVHDQPALIVDAIRTVIASGATS